MSGSNGKKPISSRKRRFFEFIYDRQEIWNKRFVRKDPYPWTKDPILKSNKFCNVYRELDRGSVHLIEYIIDCEKLSLQDKILNIFLYRRFNVPYFFSEIVQPQVMRKFDWKSLEFMMDDYKKKVKKNLFNGAYIICQRNFTSSYRKSEKHIQQILLVDSLRKKVIPRVADFISSKFVNVRELHNILKSEIPMTGDFLAYQYLTDLTYIGSNSKNWDINSFTVLGKGSKPGICYLYNVPLSERNPYEEWCKDLWENQEEEFHLLYLRTGKKWGDVMYKKAYDPSPFLSISNIQNCLCEFRKYEAYNGKGNVTCKIRKFSPYYIK